MRGGETAWIFFAFLRYSLSLYRNQANQVQQRRERYVYMYVCAVRQVDGQVSGNRTKSILFAHGSPDKRCLLGAFVSSRFTLLTFFITDLYSTHAHGLDRDTHSTLTRQCRLVGRVRLEYFRLCIIPLFSALPLGGTYHFSFVSLRDLISYCLAVLCRAGYDIAL